MNKFKILQNLGTFLLTKSKLRTLHILVSVIKSIFSSIYRRVRGTNFEYAVIEKKQCREAVDYHWFITN